MLRRRITDSIAVKKRGYICLIGYYFNYPIMDYTYGLFTSIKVDINRA
jgi:hypothetical protein